MGGAVNSPEMHLASAGEAQANDRPCDYCGTLFKPTRDWSRFCRTRGNGCRNDFHAREARIEAILARAVQMYEALREIAYHSHDGEGDADNAAGMRLAAEAAIKDLKAP